MKRRGGPGGTPGLPHLQKRAGARLRSRSSSGQADKIAVVFMLENSCDVPTTHPLATRLTAFRKKMQPKIKKFPGPDCCKKYSNSCKLGNM